MNERKDKLKYLKNNKEEMKKVIALSYKIMKNSCPVCRNKLLVYVKRHQKDMPLSEYCNSCTAKIQVYMGENESS